MVALEQEGRLFRHVQEIPAPREGNERFIWLTVAAREWYRNPGKEFRQASFAMAIQQMDAFIRGARLFEGEDVKHLEPKHREVWEIRTVLERPQIRLFGWFPCQMHFVFVHAKSRDDLELHRGPKWDRAINKVVTTRAELLLPAYGGFSFADYVG